MNSGLINIVVAAIIGAASTPGAADAYRQTVSGVDFDYVHDVAAGVPLNEVVTLHQEHVFANSDDPREPSIVVKYRLWADGERRETDGRDLRDNVEKLILYGQGYVGDAQLRLGSQEVTWGENPLFPVLDVVNARDVTHPRGFYDPAAKVPAILANMEWRGETFSVQAIAAPIPSPMRQPDETGDFTIAPVRQDFDTDRAEYGGRLGATAGGIDTKLYYFRHGPRLPAYRLQAFSGDGDLIPDDHRLETYGASTSYGGETWLIRGDAARHTEVAATGIGTSLEYSALTQGIVGFNWFDSDQDTFGIEVHADSWARRPLAYTEGAFVDPEQGGQTLAWAALTANLRLFDGLLEPSAILYRGLQNNDSLVRTTVLWNISEHWTASAEYQKTNAESRSPLLLLNRTESISVKASYTY